jgi:alkanesulfonate monooxygenase SsuD/methylene tetrahydromethanopterin reductase-like flavin-dependent oxidoreductase (luciferase family)
VLGQALAKGYRGIAEEALIAGTVDEVVARFRALGELGYTDVIVRHFTNDQPRVLASLGRLAQVRRALASS